MIGSFLVTVVIEVVNGSLRSHGGDVDLPGMLMDIYSRDVA